MKPYMYWNNVAKEVKTTTNPDEFFESLWNDFSKNLIKGFYNSHPNFSLLNEKNTIKDWIFINGMRKDFPDKKFFKEKFTLGVVTDHGEFTIWKINEYTWALRTDGKVFNSVKDLVNYLINHHKSEVMKVYNKYYGDEYISNSTINKALKRVIRARKNSYDYEEDTKGWNIEFLNDLNVEVGLVDCNGRFEKGTSRDAKEYTLSRN